MDGYRTNNRLDGPPTDQDLDRISRWDFPRAYGEPSASTFHFGFVALMRFVRGLWHFADLSISTGGWICNESVIEALWQNKFFWSNCWVQSRRGGYYIFEVPLER